METKEVLDKLKHIAVEIETKTGDTYYYGKDIVNHPDAVSLEDPEALMPDPQFLVYTELPFINPVSSDRKQHAAEHAPGLVYRAASNGFLKTGIETFLAMLKLDDCIVFLKAMIFRFEELKQWKDKDE